MESCVQSQGEEEEIELISLQPPQPQRPFSSLRLLLRSTPAFLLLVIILLLLILNSQGGKKKIALLPHLLCALYPTSFAFVHPEGENGGRGGLYLARVHTKTHTTPSLHQRILHRSSRILQFTTGDRDLQMHNYLCNRARLFGDDPMQKNRGNFWCERRGGMRALRFFSSSPLIFSFLPLPSSATQNWRLPGSARSNTSSRLRSVAVPRVREVAGPWFGTKLSRGYNSPSCKIGTCRNIPNPYQIRFLFIYFII
jgi:hypothetical protein